MTPTKEKISRWAKLRVAHASRMLAIASSRSRTLPESSGLDPIAFHQGKPVSARRQNQHARRRETRALPGSRLEKRFEMRKQFVVRNGFLLAAAEIFDPHL